MPDSIEPSHDQFMEQAVAETRYLQKHPELASESIFDVRAQRFSTRRLLDHEGLLTGYGLSEAIAAGRIDKPSADAYWFENRHDFKYSLAQALGVQRMYGDRTTSKDALVRLFSHLVLQAKESEATEDLFDPLTPKDIDRLVTRDLVKAAHDEYNIPVPSVFLGPLGNLPGLRRLIALELGVYRPALTRESAVTFGLQEMRFLVLFPEKQLIKVRSKLGKETQRPALTVEGFPTLDAITQAYNEGRASFTGRQVGDLFGGSNRFIEAVESEHTRAQRQWAMQLKSERAWRTLMGSAAKEMRYLKRNPKQRLVEVSIDGVTTQQSALDSDGLLNDLGMRRAVAEGRIHEADMTFVAERPEDFKIALSQYLNNPAVAPSFERGAF